MGEIQTFDALIIGSGLAGLMTAVRCQQAGLTVKVLEAAQRFGGRVHSVYSQTDSDTTQPDYLADLGPTWVWPPFQTSVQRVLDEHSLQLMEQFNTGPAIIERPGATAPEQFQLPGQHGMSRLFGGPQCIVDALASNLEGNTVSLGHQVVSVADKTEHIEVSTQIDGKRLIMQARAVVVAAPLRIAAENIAFTPHLSDNHQQVMKSAATWMATQAKVVLIYQNAFWRDNKLSGRVASQIGPLAEVHDHSGIDGKPAALFGFLGVTAKARAELGEQLVNDIVAQLVRCFGDQAAHPDRVIIEDWATNPFICTQRDLDETPQHPGVLPEFIRQGSWDGRLLFATAETSASSPGLIDGALEAGARAAEALCNRYP